ncbi:MAG: hypothetical protein P8X42_15805 [Calditrichaceae bacterium]|jgi:hypothetical protein
MQNLQDLYDFYMETHPSRGKLKSASTMLIRVCKMMDVNSPEDITPDKYELIPSAIDRYHSDSYNLAVQDKSILAEMIGRYGPKDGWEKTFDTLLTDRDDNLAQFTLHSLEYSGSENYRITLSYIEKFMNHRDRLMRHVSAHLVCNLLCSENVDIMKNRIIEWSENGNAEFNQVVFKSLEGVLKNKTNIKNTAQCRAVYKWLEEYLNN